MSEKSGMFAHDRQSESFWAGEFGDEYIEEIRWRHLCRRGCSLFSRILGRTSGVASVIEFGANIGGEPLRNHLLLPKAEIKSVEINATAVKTLKTYSHLILKQKSQPA